MSATPPLASAVEAWSRHLGGPVDPGGLCDRLAEGSLARAFSESATAAGDAPALTIGEVTLSHLELDERAARIGGWLASRGVSPGDRVLIAGESSHRLVGAYLGALRCGATAVPVDSGLTTAELAQVVADAEPAVAIVGAAAASLATASPALQPRLILRLEGDGRDSISAAETGPPIDPAGADAPAILAYTSGTTGEPKGVPLSHANVLSSIRAAMLAWRWSGDDVLVHALPLSHQHGLGGVHATLLAGSRAVIQPRFDPESFCSAVRRVEATMIMAVPAIYERLDTWEGIEGAGLSGLRLAVSGSAPLPPALAERVRRWLGRLPLERYGSTEAGLVLSNLYSGWRKPGSVGFPLPGVEVRMIGPDGDADPGEDGELVVRGPQVFSSYWRRAQATEEAFTDDGWFRSGDIVRADPDDGDIAITGRIKEMIISGGLNVSPREVESVLDRHPGVLRSAVAGVPSERWGEEVVAFVVARGGTAPDPEGMIAHCREHLSAYKCPKRVILLPALPRSAIGKLRREELVAMAKGDEQGSADR